MWKDFSGSDQQLKKFWSSESKTNGVQGPLDLKNINSFKKNSHEKFTFGSNMQPNILYKD
jgi:hypothetical protein